MFTLINIVPYVLLLGVICVGIFAIYILAAVTWTVFEDRCIPMCIGAVGMWLIGIGFLLSTLTKYI